MQKPIQELTPRVSDCLKLIYSLQERGLKVTTSLVSEQLGVSDATATMMFKEFAHSGWVEHIPYHGVRLTQQGELKAKEIIRHHRLLELYLSRELGYSWDKVHAEADRLEHVISEEFEDRLDTMLGSPTVDPHGDPIPSKEGVLVIRPGVRLSQLEVGQVCRVLRVNDQDPDKLCYFGSLGLYPGKTIQLEARAPFNGPLHLLIGQGSEQTSHFLSGDLAEAIVVEIIA